MNFTFTISRNGAVMVFIALLIALGYYMATDYIEFILYVATALIVGFTLSELAWHLPDEDTLKQYRITRDWGNIAKTGVKVAVASIFIIAGLSVIFLTLPIVLLYITMTTFEYGIYVLVGCMAVFLFTSSVGIGSVFVGGCILLRLFKEVG